MIDMDIIFATHNAHKMHEIRAVMAEYPARDVRVRSLAEVGFADEIAENGTTFTENAVLKARAVRAWADACGELAGVMSDDSGLEIDAMDKQPGVYSARFLGDIPYREKNAYILAQLAGVAEEARRARFRCVIAYAYADGRIKTAEAAVEGYIALDAAGDDGFGYDPIFFVPRFNRTLAQLTVAEKNSVSHRGLALRKMLGEI